MYSPGVVTGNTRCTCSVIVVAAAVTVRRPAVVTGKRPAGSARPRRRATASATWRRLWRGARVRPAASRTASPPPSARCVFSVAPRRRRAHVGAGRDRGQLQPAPADRGGEEAGRTVQRGAAHRPAGEAASVEGGRRRALPRLGHVQQGRRVSNSPADAAEVAVAARLLQPRAARAPLRHPPAPARLHLLQEHELPGGLRGDSQRRRGDDRPHRNGRPRAGRRRRRRRRPAEEEEEARQRHQRHQHRERAAPRRGGDAAVQQRGAARRPGGGHGQAVPALVPAGDEAAPAQREDVGARADR